MYFYPEGMFCFLAGKPAVGHKENALERIMADKSAAVHRQMQRFRLKREQVTRVAINPDLVPGHDVEVLSKRVLTDADLSEAAEKLDDELLDGGSFEEGASGRGGRGLPRRRPAGAPGAASRSRARQPRGALGRARLPRQHPRRGQGDSSHGRLFVARGGRFTLLGVANGHGQPHAARRLEELVARDTRCRAPCSGAPRWCAAPTPRRRSARPSTRCITARSGPWTSAWRGRPAPFASEDSDTIWVAHVGDCRAVLGVPDPEQNALSCHFAAVPLTKEIRRR
ncbi:unnamed protein product [Prorocentrum cordatum]|uniref:Protein-serine/threonine phosphatase n=1 Tax=Prorocentrum cordatum TaxID=2364126 RepID=A0ABN9V5H5_9DINO|nr:unnamed protein product [Polarella glacialis]